MGAGRGRWVTGPAIDLLVQARQIQIGDELKIVPLSGWRIPKGEYVAVVDGVSSPSQSSYWDNRERPAVCSVRVPFFIERGNAHTVWVLCRENITAWRRPKKSG